MTDVWRNPLFARTVGAAYARGVEQPIVAATVGRLAFGTDVDRMYRAMDVVNEVPEGRKDFAILDVPCGGGVTAGRLRPGHPGRYVAMDISPDMLALARRRVLPALAGTIEFVEGSIERIPYDDGEFDLCVCFNGLHCLPDPAAAVRELARVLKPGGRLVGDFAARGQLGRADVYHAVMRAVGAFGRAGTVEDARRWLASAGLEVRALESSGAVVHFQAAKPARGA